MTDIATRADKLFAGARLRRLRRDLGRTQADFAAALGVSASYLNLMERNQRPVTARVLLALAEAFDVDVKGFAAESDRQLNADLAAAASDPALQGVDLDRRDMRDLVDSHPRAAEAMARLHHALTEVRAMANEYALRVSDPALGAGAGLSPLESVRNALDEAHNHFPELEQAADAIRGAIGEIDGPVEPLLAQRLKANHGAAIRTYDDAVMDGALRRFDFHARKLMLSDRLSPEARAFHIAATMMLLEAGEAISACVERARLPGEEAAALMKASLVNYAASALLMPYDAFFSLAERRRYDVGALSRGFQASFEQVCHRLTTLNRPQARGPAFFMLKVDSAGNVTKRFGGGVMPFARSGGACSRWRLFDALRAPERPHVLPFELPDGSRYVSLARAVSRPGTDGEPTLQVVAIGCSAADASRLAWADAAAEPARTGLACRLCERPGCAERAFPPLQRQLRLDPHWRGASAFTFGGE